MGRMLDCFNVDNKISLFGIEIKKKMALLDYFFAAFDQARRQKGLKQKQVAEMFGIKENDMSRFKRGERPFHEEDQEAIAQFFGYELLDFLFFGRSILGGPQKKPPDDQPVTQADLAAFKAQVIRDIKSELNELAGSQGAEVAEADESAKTAI